MKRTEKFKKRRLRVRRFFTVIVVSLLIIMLIVFGVDRLIYYVNHAQDNNQPHTSIAVEQTTDVTPQTENTPIPQTKNTPTPKPIQGIMSPAPGCNPADFGLVRELEVNRVKTDTYTRGYSIEFGSPDTYSDLKGITCFRGNNYRDAASFENVSIKEEKLKSLWNVKIGRIETWTGVGWNGQPAIVQWSDDVRKIMNITPIKKAKNDLKEVIYATLDGKIYFLDLEDGLETRPPINVGAPHKGSVTVDPRGYPLLYAGQGIDTVEGKKVPIGYRIFSLIDQSLLHFIDGVDPFAIRRWFAFDSNPLIDQKTDTFIECGENGILHSGKLNTNFDKEKGTISIAPELVKYRYQSKISTRPGTENSIAIYRNYGYFVDNSGLIQCVDLNTLTPIWARDLTDDTDSTVAIEEVSESEVYLYTACEIDQQGNDGYSYIRKLNAFSGELLWENAIKCSYDVSVNGGTLASPVVGKKDIKDLVIFNVARTEPKKTSGKLIAYNKKTGKEAWVHDMPLYCWSSPVAIYTPEGKSYLIVCDSGGNMCLMEGTTGKTLDTLPLRANIEGSPAVFGNKLVVGTRGQQIWGVEIR